MSNEAFQNSLFIVETFLLNVYFKLYNQINYRSSYWPRNGGMVTEPVLVVIVAIGVVVKCEFRLDQSRPTGFVISLVDVIAIVVIGVVAFSASVVELRKEDLNMDTVLIFSSIVFFLMVSSFEDTTTVVGNVAADDVFRQVVVTFDGLLTVTLITDGTGVDTETSTDRLLSE